MAKTRFNRQSTALAARQFELSRDDYVLQRRATVEANRPRLSIQILDTQRSRGINDFDHYELAISNSGRMNPSFVRWGSCSRIAHRGNTDYLIETLATFDVPVIAAACTNTYAVDLSRENFGDRIPDWRSGEVFQVFARLQYGDAFGGHYETWFGHEAILVIGGLKWQFVSGKNFVDVEPFEP